MFSGSYPPSDVTFLLKVIDLPSTDISRKEELIQSGQRHYSEMITYESPPSPVYLELFHQALERHRLQLAGDLVHLARQLQREFPNSLTLVSLARAGTPIGVLLKRILQGPLAHPDVLHYSISIVRDRGLDLEALRFILERAERPPESLVFVDGWTGKGVISQELLSSISQINSQWGLNLDSRLAVVADLSGTSGWAATSQDYLIPSSILNSVVSGLISRSILNKDYLQPGDFHGCLYYEQFASQDLSNYFIEVLMESVGELPAHFWQDEPHLIDEAERERLRSVSSQFLAETKERYQINSLHHIKPGIGEATRVLLRRWPQLLLLRQSGTPEVAHLERLALEKGVAVQIDPNLPYCAVALIRQVKESSNAK